MSCLELFQRIKSEKFGIYSEMKMNISDLRVFLNFWIMFCPLFVTERHKNSAFKCSMILLDRICCKLYSKE